MKSGELDNSHLTLFHFLNDELNASPAINFENLKGNIEFFLKSEQNKVKLKGLSEVILAFITGELSKSVLFFYLDRQFNYEKNKEFSNLINNLYVMRDRLSKKNRLEIKLEKYPKVSVIITTYNRKIYLEQSINSILKQDYPNVDIVVIDDASTDGTDILMQSYPQVTYLKNDINKGPGANRLKAFNEHAKGEYVLFLDDDDYLIDMTYIRKTVNFHISNPEISFVSANVFYEHTQNNQFKISRLGLNDIVDKNDYFMNLGKEGYPKPASTLTTVFKRDKLIKMEISNMKMVNDVSIYLRSLLVGDAGFINIIAGVYRVHENNITFNLNKQFIIENLDEKIAIKNLAIDKFGYDPSKMDVWINHNVYKTIRYYFRNSAKTFGDFEFMCKWVKHNCPTIYNKVRIKYYLKFIQKKIFNFI